MSPDLKARIENDIKSNKIMIFMKGSRDFPQCGFSAAAVDVFNRLGVDYETRDVLADMDLRQGIKEFSNWPTIPQVYVNGQLVGGSDILMELWESGELAGKPAAAFTAGYSRSGGIEATLLQLFHLLIAHGLVFVGLPWTERMRVSGSYYGATAHGAVTADDREQAAALGRRVAALAETLKRSEAG